MVKNDGLSNEQSSFFGIGEYKEQFLAGVTEHYHADEIVQGLYWDGAKGCNIGCAVECTVDVHGEWSRQTGVPEWLGLLGDTLFEGLSTVDSKHFVVDFHDAIPVGKMLFGLMLVEKSF